MRVILFILFLMNPLIAVDEELGILYPSIKTNIINGDMDSAQKEIEERMKKGESNSALNLYQTEIWISKADELYDSKKYKSSFEYYKLAYEKWSSHPVVYKRYNELKSKKLYDIKDKPAITQKFVNPLKQNSEKNPNGIQELKYPEIYNVNLRVSGLIPELKITLIVYNLGTYRTSLYK